MRTKKVDLEYYKTLIADLAKKRNRTPEDEVNLAAFRKVVADEELRIAKETFESAKKDALIKILTANGITTENCLKEIIATVQIVNPDLVPGPAKRKEKVRKKEEENETTDPSKTDEAKTDEAYEETNEDSGETPTEGSDENLTEETSNEEQNPDQ